MSKTTTIQWCDSTVNPTMGCNGCELWVPERRSCYAGKLHDRYGGRTGYAPSFAQVTRFPGRMAQAARWTDLAGCSRSDNPWLDGSPRLIFVSDMSDALSKGVSFEYLESEIIAVVTSAEGQRHRWLWLTKRPSRMAEFSRWLAALGQPWPENLWVGTSITDAKSLERISSLLKVGDARTTRFLSVEPQVEPISLAKWLPELDWVIQGGESGLGARPFDLDWARSLVAECTTAGVPYFLKQLGEHPVEKGQRLELQDRHGGDWIEWPEELRRREVPGIPAQANCR
ncbi:DUF5131 family protein [Cystobacter ferrugineus]|uniref:Phage Gp37/Gp68 family protein n=1 Tax=Cystobacter ferrugineus TaxID=83449 RepID=A0A1L9B7P3_9BACT|nr:DUF5131 family protein [Cystobacter ferrugineus]OJH38265.1 hypothetical protein BON30_24300 [Cystobacter ferrugineus]